MGAVVSTDPHEVVVRSAFAANGTRRATDEPLADGDVVVASTIRVVCMPFDALLKTALYKAAVETFRDAAVGNEIVTKTVALSPVVIPPGAQETNTALQLRFAKLDGRNATREASLSQIPGVLTDTPADNRQGYRVLADPGVFGNRNVALIATSLVNSVALVLHMIDATPAAAAAVMLRNVDDTRMIVGFVLAILGGGCVYNLGGQARFDSRGPVDDMLGIRKDCDGMATSTCTAVAALLRYASEILDDLAVRDGGAGRAELRLVAAMVVTYLWATTATAGMAFLLARTPGFGDGHSDLDRTVHDTKACVQPFGHAVAVLIPLKKAPPPFAKGTAGAAGGVYAAAAGLAKALRSQKTSATPLVVESTASMADRLVGTPSGVVTLLPNADGVYSNLAKNYGALLKRGFATLYGPDGKPVEATWDAASVGGLVTAGSFKMCRPYYPGSYMKLWVLYTGDDMIPATNVDPDGTSDFHAALAKAARPRARLFARSLEHGYERQPCGTVTPHMAALAADRTRRLYPHHPPGELVELGPLPRRTNDNAFVVTLSPFDAEHIAAAPRDRLVAIDAFNYALINTPHPAYTRAEPPAAPPAAPSAAPSTVELAPELTVFYTRDRGLDAAKVEQLIAATNSAGLTVAEAKARIDTELVAEALIAKYGPAAAPIIAAEKPRFVAMQDRKSVV